jgi:hypothetical protein
VNTTMPLEVASSISMVLLLWSFAVQSLLGEWEVREFPYTGSMLASLRRRHEREAVMRYETVRNYHRQRAEQEFKLGCQARHPKARSSHFKLFDLHVRSLLKADGTGEFDVATSAIGRPTRRDWFDCRSRRSQTV